MTHFLIIITSMIVGGLLASLLAQAANNIDKRLLHYEVELDNGYICHECGQAYPCPTLVETRS